MSIATISKEHRCHIDEVYVVGFVPSYLIPKKRSQALDPFLEPLIKDLEEGFKNGIPVDYAATVNGIPADPANIRHLLLCWKGDHNGQCEAGNSLSVVKRVADGVSYKGYLCQLPIIIAFQVSDYKEDFLEKRGLY